MERTVRHCDAVVVTKESIHGEGVGEGGPTGGGVLRAAADEERARGHEGVQFVKIVALRDELRVGAGARGGGGDETARARDRRVEAEIPGFLIVDAGARFVEDDAGVGPDGAGEFVGEARGEQRPFAAVGVTDDADARGVDVRQAGEGGVGVGGEVGEIGERLALRAGLIGMVGVAARRAETEGDEAAFRELVAEIAQGFRRRARGGEGEAGAGVGFVKRDDDGGEGAGAGWDEEKGVLEIAGGEFEADEALFEIFAGLGADDIKFGGGEEFRPRAEEGEPAGADRGALAVPLGGGGDARTVGADEGRAAGIGRRGGGGGRLEKGREVGREGRSGDGEDERGQGGEEAAEEHGAEGALPVGNVR